MARLDPQVQFELTVNPVDALVVPFEAFHGMITTERQAGVLAPQHHATRSTLVGGPVIHLNGGACLGS